MLVHDIVHGLRQVRRLIRRCVKEYSAKEAVRDANG